MNSFDVIVPCYRYGHFLRECVESVLSQAVENVRILIIDDASPDNTAEVAADLVREDSRVPFVRHTINKGHIATYNEWIEWASADYMLLLSADDYLLPGALSRAANLLDAFARPLAENGPLPSRIRGRRALWRCRAPRGERGARLDRSSGRGKRMSRRMRCRHHSDRTHSRISTRARCKPQSKPARSKNTRPARLWP
jgi:glycosyltransferase involved in cell wall biosynthesis